MVHSLSLIQNLLEKKTFICQYIPATKETPFDRLIIFLSADSKKREHLLEIIESQQQLSQELISSQILDFPQRLRFRVELPIKVENIALNQMASLLLFVNRFLDIPGFELDELEGKVSYRYVWITRPQAIDAVIIDNIIGMIGLNLTLFTDIIESIANGSMSFNDLLAQIIGNKGPFT